MRKIPTLFVRDESRRRVTDEVLPGCEWVIDGEGVATRKFDGTCVLFDGTRWWARREIKSGKTVPDRFRPEQQDDVTGKTVGWEPAGQSSYARYLADATESTASFPPGTYELCGPKVNGNPEGFTRHVVVPHGQEPLDAPRNFDGLRDWLAGSDVEGVVWHHTDGRRAKLKRRDFPRDPPSS